VFPLAKDTVVLKVLQTSVNSLQDFPSIEGQYVQEFPMNHLDLPREQLTETGKDMKDLMEGVSRFQPLKD
jgi:hypothetical protein